MKKLLTILFFVSILNTLYSQTITTNTIYRWNNGTGFREMSDPPCPAAGYSIVWERSDGHLYLMNDACAIFDLTTGSGGTLTSFTDGNGFDGTVTGSALSLTTQLTTGSVPFIGASGALTQDNSNFFFNNTGDKLGIGINSALPARLVVKGFGASSTDTSFLVKSGGDVEMLWVIDDNGVVIRPAANARYNFSGNILSFIDDGGNIRSQTFTGSDFTFSYAYLRNANLTIHPVAGLASSGVYTDFTANGTDAFIAGDGDMKMMSLRPTWNIATATNNGAVVGYYYNATVTALAGGNKHWGLFLQNGYTRLGDVSLGTSDTMLIMDGREIKYRLVSGLGGSGEINTASNLGGGLANYSTKVGVDLQFNSFLATDFNLASNLISIDYTNAQKATTSTIGFLTDTDWDLFKTVDQPLDQILVGTGAGATSSSDLTWNSGTLTFNATNVVGVGLFAIDAGNQYFAAAAGDVYLGSTTQTYFHFNENFIKYIESGSGNEYFKVDRTTDLTQFSNVSGGTFGRRLLLDGGTKVYGFGDLDDTRNGAKLWLDDQNLFGYLDNTAHDLKIGINTTTPAVELDLVGNIRISGLGGGGDRIVKTDNDGDLSAITTSTVGLNFVGLTDPSAITFPRINADNSVTALSAASFVTAIGASTMGYTMQGSFGQFNPGDATTYYGGGAPQSGGTVAAVNRMYITRTGTIKACYILFDNGGTLGSSETSTIYLRVNNTSETAVSAAVTNDARPTVVSNTGLSIAVTAGDYVEMKWVTPAWPVTNPTNVRILGVFYVE